MWSLECIKFFDVVWWHPNRAQNPFRLSFQFYSKAVRQNLGGSPDTRLDTHNVTDEPDSLWRILLADNDNLNFIEREVHFSHNNIATWCPDHEVGYGPLNNDLVSVYRLRSLATGHNRKIALRSLPLDCSLVSFLNLGCSYEEWSSDNRILCPTFEGCDHVTYSTNCRQISLLQQWEKQQEREYLLICSMESIGTVCGLYQHQHVTLWSNLLLNFTVIGHPTFWASTSWDLANDLFSPDPFIHETGDQGLGRRLNAAVNLLQLLIQCIYSNLLHYIMVH